MLPARDLDRSRPLPSTSASLDVLAATPIRALRETVPRLAEPRSMDLEAAHRILARFIEAMAGFAVGAVAQQVLAGVRRWFGPDGVRQLRAALGGWPRRGAVRFEPTAPVSRTLVDELHVRLHARSSELDPELRRLLDALPERPSTPALVRALVQPVTLDGLIARISDELAFGWQLFAALAEPAPRRPALADRAPSSRALWGSWLDRITGAPPAMVRDPAEAEGYILLVR
jgi:hypothetical protein